MEKEQLDKQWSAKAFAVSQQTCCNSDARTWSDQGGNRCFVFLIYTSRVYFEVPHVDATHYGVFF